MKRIQKPFTPKELLIALAIVSGIATIPAGVCAAPAKKAWDDSAVTQVKDSLRQIADAATLWEKTGGCKMRECTGVDNLIAAGKLTGAPKVPSGIGVGEPSPYFSSQERRMGGCGPGTSGAPRTNNPALKNVSEQFCRAYNDSVGLGSTIVGNCASGGDCSASGSTNPYDFPMVSTPSFCYLNRDVYVIVWMSSVSAPPCQ